MTARSLLVTGGAGFIGTNFVRHWAQAHPDDRLVVLDALTYAGNLAGLSGLNTHPRFRMVRGDIGDQQGVERILLEEKIDTIVHFAAESHVDRSIAEPAVFIRTNVLGTHSLLEAARSVWLGGGAGGRAVDPAGASGPGGTAGPPGAFGPRPHRFHHVSTDEVYGSLSPTDPPFTESNPYAPNSPYAASKAASDHLVRAYHHTYGLNTTISNCSNNYGAYHFPEKLIPLAIVNILHGKALPIYGDGRNVRDWLHVSDHCQGIERILDGGVAGSVYNIGGRCESTNIDLVRLLCSIADAAFERQPQLAARFPASPAARGEPAAGLISFVKDRPGHDRRYAIDCSKLTAELGFTPRVSLESGLRATFDWYLENESWWRGVMDGTYRRWIESQYAPEALRQSGM